MGCWAYTLKKTETPALWSLLSSERRRKPRVSELICAAEERKQRAAREMGRHEYGWGGVVRIIMGWSGTLRGGI